MPEPTPERKLDRPPGVAMLPLAALVCKQGVSIGLLPAADRRRALALVWCCLPQGAGLNEAAVNAHLMRVLDGPGRFLRTDHVELRRWLVDEGWLQRDGFGREYRAVSAAALAPDCQQVAAPLADIDVTVWVDDLRREKQLAAERRRTDWSARQGAN